MTNLVYTFDYLYTYDPAKPMIALALSLPGRE